MEVTCMLVLCQHATTTMCGCVLRFVRMFTETQIEIKD